jgi:hypothetical protein
MGLREQIRKANSESEITSLLSKGNNFDMASGMTRRAWKSTARFRLGELNNPNPTPKSVEKPVEPKKVKNKTKKS